MKSPNIISFYNAINKELALIEGFTEIKNLSFILQSCRVKPLQYLLEKNTKTILYDHWIDEYQNSVYLRKKKLEIVFNDLSIKDSIILCSDIYDGLTIKNVCKISKLLYICTGINEDDHNPWFHLNFLGVDNFYRSFLYSYNELTKIAPLTMGFDNLQYVTKNIDIKHFLYQDKLKNNPLPCVNPGQWLTYLPAHELFMRDIKSKNIILFDFLKEIFN